MFDIAIDRQYHAAEAEEIHLSAYNAAFYELGLRWHWCADTYRELRRHAGNSDAVKVYLETHQPHLLKAYDADFLSRAIEATKQRRYEEMLACGARRGQDIDWAAIQCVEIGV
jgi:hypothetical protein